MTRGPRRGEPTAPQRLCSLSLRQADWLRRARDTDGGIYLPLTTPSDIYALVDGGVATLREVKRSSGTKSVHDPRPCEWIDHYLVPTEYGVSLLAKATP